MKKDGTLFYSPTDLIRFMESPFATWMERFNLEFPALNVNWCTGAPSPPTPKRGRPSSSGSKSFTTGSGSRAPIPHRPWLAKSFWVVQILPRRLPIHPAFQCTHRNTSGPLKLGDEPSPLLGVDHVPAVCPVGTVARPEKPPELSPTMGIFSCRQRRNSLRNWVSAKKHFGAGKQIVGNRPPKAKN